jgi:hypothetical protein
LRIIVLALAFGDRRQGRSGTARAASGRIAQWRETRGAFGATMKRIRGHGLRGFRGYNGIVFRVERLLPFPPTIVQEQTHHYDRLQTDQHRDQYRQ